MARILLVEDDRVLRRAMAHALKKAGYSVVGKINGSAATGVITAADYDIVVDAFWRLSMALPSCAR